MNNQYRDDEMELEHLVFLYGFRTAATGRKGLSADRSDSHYCEGYALGKRFRQEKIDAGYKRIRRPSDKVI